MHSSTPNFLHIFPGPSKAEDYFLCVWGFGPPELAPFGNSSSSDLPLAWYWGSVYMSLVWQLCMHWDVKQPKLIESYIKPFQLATISQEDREEVSKAANQKGIFL